MPIQTLTSDKQKTKVGTVGTELETFTQTTFERDSNGKIIPASIETKLLYNNSTTIIPSFVPAASSKDGGKTWDMSSFRKPDGTLVLGTDAQRSLRSGALKTTVNQQIQTAGQKEKLSPNDLSAISSKASSEAKPSPNESETALDTELSKAPGRSKYSKTLRYPANLQLEHQDIIQFNMLKYEPRTLGTGENAGSFNERSNYESRTIGIVHLPIPAGISDTNSVTWGSDSLSATDKALADVANAFIGAGGDAGANEAGKKIEAISNYSGEIKEALKPYFIGQAIGKANILSRTKGAIQNPNMELLFSAPTLRPFTFTFRLSARGQGDREQIRQIIRFFKQGMAVQRTPSQLFLKAPNTFKIRYLHQNADHRYINKIKECALQSFTVSYTPDGNYMTFSDGLMTSYEIQMQFQELEPIFNDDYGNLDGTSIDTEIGY
jgi:hypothetical protein